MITRFDHRITALMGMLFCGLRCMATLTADAGIYSPPHCGYNDGKLYVMIQGGFPCGGCTYPYHVLWNTGDTTEMINAVPAGTYTVTVTDDSMNVAYDTLDVFAENFQVYMQWLPICPDTGAGPVFEGFIRGSSGVLWVDQMVGPGPHNLSGGFTEVLYTDSFNLSPWDSVYHIIPPLGWGPPGSGGVIPYTDAYGCPGQIDWFVPIEPVTYASVQVLQLDGACTGANNGQLRLALTGSSGSPFPPVQGLERSDGTPVSANEYLGAGGTAEVFYRTLAPGDYAYVQQFGAHAGPMYSWPWLEFLEPWFDGSECADSVFVTIADNGSTCGTLGGKVFLDSDEDCSYLYSEARIPGMVMEIQPGSHYTITGAQGNYSINLPLGGGYTVEQQTSVYDEHCFGGMAFNITPGVYVTRDQADTSLTDMDAAIGMGSGPARPGFQMAYGFDVQNLTATNTGAITVTMVLDPVLVFLSASVAPSSVVGNTITWSLPNQNGFTMSHINVYCQVPPDPLLIGDTLTTTIDLATTTLDLDPSNNTFTHEVVVTGSFDPNDKSVSPGDQFTLGEDSTLTYTIRFQNTGTDTAFLVVVVDTLPTEVDPGTFEMLAASHPYTLDIQGHGVLRWMFPFILLPDSNTNEPMSHGFVTFRIRPRWPLFPGTGISNAADIYFDYNPPVHTNDAVVTAEMTTGANANVHDTRVIVAPNPANDEAMIALPDHGDQLLKIELYSADGRLLRSRGATGRSCELDLSKIPSGVHIVKVFTAAGAIHQERLIHQ